MIPLSFLIGFVVLVTVAWLINTYNRFISYKNRIEESWSGIEVALKRRANLIPNLIRTIEGYSHHEETILRSGRNYGSPSAGISNRAEEESRISESLRGLLALAEAYPDLKASANFIDLQQSLDQIEEDIQKARNQFNSHVRKFNTLIESFPAVYLARKFGYEKQHYFKLDLATQRELPAVDFSAGSSLKQ